MGLNDSFLRFEKRYAWSFFGFLLAIIFGTFSIYTVYFIDTNPKLDFIVESNTKVLDLRENVKKLEILYEKENINDNDKNLSILKIKIQNTSSVNILSTFYDTKDPLGFKFNVGEIVEQPEIVEASTDYIKNSLSIALDSLGYVIFNPIIIDGKEFFTLKVLVLHKQNEILHIKAFGKVAGVKEIGILESYKNTEEKSFWHQLIEGTFFVHLVRFFAYLTAIILTALLIIIPTSLISDSLTERSRKKKVRKYKTKKKLTDSVERDLIYELYVTSGLGYLVEVERLFVDEKNLKIKLRSHVRRLDKRHQEITTSEHFENIYSGTHVMTQSHSGRRVFINERNFIIERLYNDKIIQLTNNDLTINNQFVADLKEFVSYLKLI